MQEEQRMEHASQEEDKVQQNVTILTKVRSSTAVVAVCVAVKVLLAAYPSITWTFLLHLRLDY